MSDSGAAQSGPPTYKTFCRKFKDAVARLFRAALPKWLRRYPRRTKAMIVTLLLTFFTGWLDLLGIHSSLSIVFDNIAQRVLAPYYDGDPGQRGVTVVLIDKAFMASTARYPGWPMPTNFFLRRIVDPIVAAKPAAVFLDLTFTDTPRPMAIGGMPDSEQSLTALASGLREASKSAPILVSDIIVPDRDATPQCPAGWIDSAMLSKQSVTSRSFIRGSFGSDAPSRDGWLEIVAANWIGDSRYYPTQSMLVSPRNICNRAQSGSGNASDDLVSKNSGYLVTPAVASLAAVCATGHSLNGANLDGLCRQIARNKILQKNGTALYRLGEKLQEPIQLRWGIRLSENMHRHFVSAVNADACREQMEDTRFSAFTATLREAWNTFIPFLAQTRNGASGIHRCVYIDTISAADLNARMRSDSDNRHIAEDFIKDRIVLVGTDLDFVSDYVTTQTNGEIPAVFLHAVALENLITSGVSYRKSPTGVRYFFENIIEAFLALLFSYGIGKCIKLVKTHCFGANVSLGKRILIFIMTWPALGFCVFAISLCISLAISGMSFFYCSPIYVALSAIAVMSEDMCEVYFGVEAEDISDNSIS